MKNFLSLLVFTLPNLTMLAGGGNPPAPPKGPPAPPGLPVDQYLIPLFIVGLIIFMSAYKQHNNSI
jgi:hypothetical protein